MREYRRVDFQNWWYYCWVDTVTILHFFKKNFSKTSCFFSRSITLLPGDVILTGTPAGVGMHRNPPEFLKPGDVIESEIESLGKIINKVVAPWI